jgi:probable DNA metabolism protein
MRTAARGISSWQRISRPLELEVSCDPEITLLRKMVHSVICETHKMKAFVRLEPLDSYALYGYLKPKHKVGAHVCDHFARRNPGTLIILGNSRESWISLYSGGKIQHDHSDGLPQILDILKSGTDSRNDTESGNGSENFEKIWKVYYACQYSSERRNLRLFQSRMPKRYLKSAGAGLELNQCDASLFDFIQE